jgi:hypothetical protein
LVAAFNAFTVASGTAAPVGSVTVPVMAPTTCCEWDGREQMRMENNRARTFDELNFIFDLSLSQQFNGGWKKHYRHPIRRLPKEPILQLFDQEQLSPINSVTSKILRWAREMGGGLPISPCSPKSGGLYTEQICCLNQYIYP